VVFFLGEGVTQQNSLGFFDASLVVFSNLMLSTRLLLTEQCSTSLSVHTVAEQDRKYSLVMCQKRKQNVSIALENAHTSQMCSRLF